MIAIAKEKDISPAQLSLAWLFSKGHITSPILGVTSIKHMEEAVDALKIKISADEIARLEEVYKSQPINGHFYEYPNIHY